MIGNSVKLKEFQYWLKFFNENDDVKPKVKVIECRNYTWFEMYRKGINYPFMETEAYDNRYIKWAKKTGMLDDIYNAV